MADGLENPTAAACVQAVLVLEADDGHKEIGREQQKGSLKLRRSYTDDREGTLVHFHRTAHRAGIILEMTVPISVAEYDIRSAVGAVLIGGMEETANVRLNLYYVEVVSGYFIEPRAGRVLARVQSCLGHVISRQTIEAAAAIPKIQIIGIRLSTPRPFAKLKSVEALRLWDVQRAEHEGVQCAKHDCVSADGSGQGHDGNRGEAGGFTKKADCVAHVLQERFHESSPRGFAGFFFVTDVAAELDARAARGFATRETGALEIVSTMLDVGTKLLFHLGVHLRALKESGDAETKRVEEFHSCSSQSLLA